MEFVALVGKGAVAAASCEFDAELAVAATEGEAGYRRRGRDADNFIQVDSVEQSFREAHLGGIVVGVVSGASVSVVLILVVGFFVAVAMSVAGSFSMDLVQRDDP